LLKWWAGQNVKKRPLMPGLSLSNVGEKWDPDEIVNQIKITRSQPGASGEILWNLHKLFDKKNNLAEQLAKTVYTKPALLPAYPWLSSTAPPKPTFTAKSEQNGLNLTWQTSPKIGQWALQKQVRGQWSLEILPGEKNSRQFRGEVPEAIALTAIDRFGNASAPATFEKK
ncbi:MAG: hypothetical protein M3Y82_01805, partial [Verrucomicrobiota bacterium]|nr:hypothetical protein [Verrucomicrobiota bacterium]